MSQQIVSEVAEAATARIEKKRGWQQWTPYAAVVWSLMYGALGIYWAVGGGGFPYTPSATADPMGPIIGRFGPVVDWVVVILAGLPAAIIAVAMLRGVRSRVLRPIFITVGTLLAGVLLLLMTSLNLLILFGYIPYTIRGLLSRAEFTQVYVAGLTDWSTLHQLLCLAGGFIWLAATVSYTRWSGGACVYCGRRDDGEGWQSPDNAMRWGRIALYVSLVVPVFYAFTRYAWALGIPLGITEEYLRLGQVRGTWISGLFLATFGLVGAIISLGLVFRWGEVFPRWMIGLAGRRVPIGLAVIPASLVSVLLVVGGAGIWSGLGGMVNNLVANGTQQTDIIRGILFEVGPTLLFPVWGLALAVATLGYYYRRRGPCAKCGRGG